MTTLGGSDEETQLNGDPCPLCREPLPDMWEGVLECETCGWQAWQPLEPWPPRSRGSADRADSPSAPRLASGSDPDQPREDLR